MFEKNKTYVAVTATIINEGKDSTSNDEPVYYPEVEYTVNGTRYRSKAKTGSSTRKSKNTKIKIKYNPDNPEEIIMVNDLSNFVLLILGPMFTVGGIFIAIKAGKNKNNSETISDPNVNSNVLNETVQQNGLYTNPEIVNEVDTNVSQNTNNNNQNNINM